MRRESTVWRLMILAGLALTASAAATTPADEPVPGGGHPVNVPIGSGVTTTPGTGSGSDTGKAISSTKLTLVLESEAVADQVAADVVAAGFAEPEEIPRLNPRFGVLRLLIVPSVDAATRSTLQAIDGVVAVRRVLLDRADRPVLLTDEIFVKVDGVSVSVLAAEYGCVVTRSMDGLDNVYKLLLLDETAADAQAVADLIATEPGVVYSHPNRLFQLEKTQVFDEIDDPYYPWQWHLENTGQLEGAVVDADVDAERAWETTLGENARIAVIDDSIQWDHEDIAANYVTGHDYADQDGDPYPALGPLFPDPVGDAHGIMVSGIVCAAANGVGVRGVAPAAGLVGIRIGFGFAGSSDEDIADAFLFAERNGAMAINNSWGGPGFPIVPDVPNTEILLPSVISDAINTVATRGRGGRGVLVLFSAGNDSTQIETGNVFAALPRVMSIGATFRDDTLTCYSNFGRQQSVVAPGSGSFDCIYESSIATTDLSARDGLVDPVSGWPLNGINPPKTWSAFLDPFTGEPILIDDPSVEDLPDWNYTRHMNGTSAACPVATGVAALVFSVNPGLTAYQVRNIIEHTADQVVGFDGDFDPVTGHNPFLGHGRVNAGNAVAAAVNQLSWPSPVENLLADQNLQTVALTWELPDWNGDGRADPEIDSVLVVQGPRGGLNWSPQDGVEYFVEQQVDANVFVIENDLVEEIVVEGVPAAEFEYAVWTVSGQQFYSWGARSELSDLPIDPGIGGDGLSITTRPGTGLVPLAVEFFGGGVDPFGGDFVFFNWNFGDQTTGQGAVTTHTYVSPGTYRVTLTGTSTSGLTRSTVTEVQVLSEPNSPPFVVINPLTPTTGPTPLRVVLEAVAIDPDPGGSISSLSWDFGDGTTGVGQTVEHVYALDGTYVVVLTAVDDLGAVRQVTQVVKATPVLGDVSGATTDPPAAGSPLPPSCGAGVPGAMAFVLSVLFGAAIVRRRGR